MPPYNLRALLRLMATVRPVGHRSRAASRTGAGHAAVVDPAGAARQHDHAGCLRTFRTSRTTWRTSSPGTDQALVPGQVNRALLTMLSTYPLGSPSGGFTYTIDPALGTLTRSSESFGPSFAERALTTGRGKVSAGLRVPARRLRHVRRPEPAVARREVLRSSTPDCCSRGSRTGADA